MKVILLTVISFIPLCSSNLSSQIISHFTWDSDPVTSAEIGPDGESVSSSAYSSPGGVGGTNGLNPALSGEPKANINLDIPASPTFDVPGIDISIDFQRNESIGSFVNRGDDLVFGMDGGNLFVSFRLEDGAGGFNTVNSGNIYSIPYDNTFRTYRFFYNPLKGKAELRVDGVNVWSYSGTIETDMYWSATTLRVGDMMDGEGIDAAVFDNLIIGQVIDSALPVEMINFSSTVVLDYVILNWITISENNNNYFLVQRSGDGYDFETIGKINGSGNSIVELNYEFKDKSPLSGVSYYRLKQIDFNGVFDFSSTVSVSIENPKSELDVFPIPAVKTITVVSSSECILLNSTGQQVECASYYRISKSHLVLDISNLPKGFYFVKTQQQTRKILID